MNTTSFQMINLSVSDLTELISNCVKAELQKMNNVIQLNPKVESDELLSRKKTTELLGVSYTTLFHYFIGTMIKLCLLKKWAIGSYIIKPVLLWINSNPLHDI